MIKLIDPSQRETWVHPEDESFVVEYRAYAGPMLTADIAEIAREYVNYGVTKVTNGGEDVPKPDTGWASILPADIQTPLFVAITRLSKLTPEEEEDLPLPPGSVSTEKSTIVTDAGGITGGA